MNAGANTKADFYFEAVGPWEPVVRALRHILLECDVAEEVKWGKPCYTAHGGNIVLIQDFKNYCAIMFPKGALLKDPEGVLVQMTANTQSARQIRFESANDVRRLEPIIKAYVAEASANEAAGLNVAMKETAEFVWAEEFQQKLEELPALREAFLKLTPGRQRAYLLHFSSAKQSKTRLARIEKNVDRILEGLGLND